MNNFGALPIFVAVIESGGFSSAARKLGISKSAVSKRITQLEHTLGVRLLHRTTRRLSLTEAGERYFEYATRAVASAADAEDAVAQLQGKPQGRLRIHTLMSFGHLHVAPIIPEFLKRYPDIHINMVMDDKVVDLVEGGFDVAIRAGEQPDSSLVARKLSPCRSVLCASPDYVANWGRPKTPSELLEHNCVVYSYSNSANEWTFTRQSRSEKILVSGNYQVNNSEALRETLLKGIGIGRVPTFIVGPDLISGRLIPLLNTYEMPSRMLYAVFPERQYLPAKVRVFLDFAIERFGGDEPYWDVSV